MEMNLYLNAPFMCAGENASRVLKIHTNGEEENGSVRIAFMTPGGKTLLTPELTAAELSDGYEVPCAVLDRYGKLLAQIIVTGENGFCKKSDICVFEVRPEISENGFIPETGGLISLAQVESRLKIAEEFLSGLIPIPEAELAQILI